MTNELSVTYMSGPLDGKTLYFEQPEAGEERILLIGRREGCDILIDFDNQASRVHAKLVIGATESVVNPYTLAFWLEDGGSRNGTYLEKEKGRHLSGKREGVDQRPRQPATGDAVPGRPHLDAPRYSPQL